VIIGDGTTNRFLRDECKMLAILLDIEVRDMLTVNEDTARQRIIKSLDELNAEQYQHKNEWSYPQIADETNLHSALPTTASPDESNIRSGVDSYIETTKHTNSRSCRIAEVNVLETDVALDIFRNIAFFRLGVNIRSGVQQGDNVRSGALGQGDIGHERKDVSGLHSSKHSPLFGSGQRVNSCPVLKMIISP
jgi:hypothetical protein